MKPLQNKKTYLSGPIELDNSNFNWRPEVKEVLTSRFGIEVFDPYDDPKQLKAGQIKVAKESEDFDTLAQIASDFVSKDLMEVGFSHMLIANLPYKVPTYGTMHEIINAVNNKIPTLIVCTEGKKNIPSWIFGVLKNKHQWYLHGSWDSLYSYLEEVDNYKHINDRRWRYVYGEI